MKYFINYKNAGILFGSILGVLLSVLGLMMRFICTELSNPAGSPWPNGGCQLEVDLSIYPFFDSFLNLYWIWVILIAIAVIAVCTLLGFFIGFLIDKMGIMVSPRATKIFLILSSFIFLVIAIQILNILYFQIKASYKDAIENKSDQRFRKEVESILPKYVPANLKRMDYVQEFQFDHWADGKVNRWFSRGYTCGKWAIPNISIDVWPKYTQRFSFPANLKDYLKKEKVLIKNFSGYIYQYDENIDISKLSENVKREIKNNWFVEWEDEKFGIIITDVSAKTCSISHEELLKIVDSMY